MKNVLILDENNWRESVLTNAVVSQSGHLKIADGQLRAEILTDVIAVETADSLVVSFNSDTVHGGYVEISIRLITDLGVSRWFSYGKWGMTCSEKGIALGQSDHYARLSIDDLIFQNGLVLNAVQFNIQLVRDHLLDKSPAVRKVYTTFQKNAVMTKRAHIPEIDYTVPQKSQMTVPKIGNSICSPTTVAMVLGYYGKTIEVFDVANAVFDHVSGIYGNWTYNVAYATELGFNGFVYHCIDKTELFDLLEEGYPLIASIRTQSQEELRGAPQAYPHGHLVVVRGSTNVDGSAKLIVNDPAGKTDEDVLVQYDVEEFMNVWRGVLYIITDDYTI